MARRASRPGQGHGQRGRRFGNRRHHGRDHGERSANFGEIFGGTITLTPNLNTGSITWVCTNSMTRGAGARSAVDRHRFRSMNRAAARPPSLPVPGIVASRRFSSTSSEACHGAGHIHKRLIASESVPDGGSGSCPGGAARPECRRRRKKIPIPEHYAGWEHLLLDIDPRGEPTSCATRVSSTRSIPISSMRSAARTTSSTATSTKATAFSRFLHVLKPDGFAEIRVPDIQTVARS